MIFIRIRTGMRTILTLTGLLVLGACGTGTDRTSAAPSFLTLATTTSVQNSGLLDYLLPDIRKDVGIEFRVQQVGSGRALVMLQRGDADVAISHAPEAEASALKDARGWHYRKIMFNDFVIVGPRHDPAQIASAGRADDAFRRIAARASFVSRADQSGTHERERQLWKAAGVMPPPAKLIASGAGMATTLRQANEVDAYTLTDRATFAMLQPRLSLRLLLEGDPALLNTYAIVVPPGRRAKAAMSLADWLTDGRGRQRIREFVLGGRPAFTPWPDGCKRDTPDSLPCRY